jgi:zinc protease
VIVGEVDLAKLRPLVETYLASLPAKGRREKEKDPGVRRATGTVKKSWKLGSEPKARVVMTFHGPETWTRDKERDMFVLRDVLRARLRETLREDLGGVYGVSAGGGLSRSPRQERSFTISFGCDPQRTDELIAATLKEIEAVKQEGSDLDALEKIKQQFLRGRETQLRQNGFWAAWLEGAYRYGDDPALILDTAPVVARMTPENVKAAARRFLSGPNLFQAVMLPADTSSPAGP